VNTTPLQYRISDVVHMRIDEDEHDGSPVIEMEFKFVRYRLVLDDPIHTEELRKMIAEILLTKPKEPGEKVELPKFYRKGVDKP
jgi:hypothetical protein